VTRTPTGKFPKTAHLLRHADFQRVYKQGRRQFSGNMTVFYLRAADTGEAANRARVGFTVPRALGGSVDRNRIRRRMREAVRHNLALLSDVAAAVDIVFNPKRAAIDAPLETLSQEVARAFEVIRKNLKPRSQHEPATG